jgi:hypothetical protein
VISLVEIVDEEIKKQESPVSASSKENEIHIVDSKRGGPLCAMFVMSMFSFVVVGGMILAILNVPQWAGVFVFILICWGCFMLGLGYYLRGTLRKRLFNLTDEYIEFHVPPAPLCKVFWADFDEIFITKRTDLTFFQATNLYLDIAFRGKTQETVISLDASQGFHRSKGNQILAVIEDRAVKKGKRFVFPEKGIIGSGIFKHQAKPGRYY